MNRRSRWFSKWMVGVGVSYVFSGCLSTQNQSSLGNGESAGPSQSPFVEALIEYPGPEQRWLGAKTFVVSVRAKDSGPAQIAVIPGFRADPSLDSPAGEPTQIDGTTSGRGPAAALGLSPVPTKKMSAEEARQILSHLHIALQGNATPFQGCMYPLRVKMIRADGGIFEKIGCRSETGWSRVVSETSNMFMMALFQGQGATAVTKKKDVTPTSSAKSIWKFMGTSN